MNIKGSSRFLESSARTAKLSCSDCGKKIVKNEHVIFELDDYERRPMQNVYCSLCKSNYEDDVDDCHPFSEDAF